MIPLWKMCSERNVRLLIKESCPRWANITISDRGKYLGFIVGPRAELTGWSKPLQKFKARVDHWAALKLGIGLNIIVFNTYIITVLEYVAQLLEVTEEVQLAMSWALRKLGPGPGTRISQRDLENLKSFGFKNEFKTIALTARAAKLRVVEPVAADVTQKCGELGRTLADSWARPFGASHNSSFYQTLQSNIAELSNYNIFIADIHSRSSSKEYLRKSKTSFQREARDVIKNKLDGFDAEERMRTRVKR